MHAKTAKVNAKHCLFMNQSVAIKETLSTLSHMLGEIHHQAAASVGTEHGERLWTITAIRNTNHLSQELYIQLYIYHGYLYSNVSSSSHYTCCVNVANAQVSRKGKRFDVLLDEPEWLPGAIRVNQYNGYVQWDDKITKKTRCLHRWLCLDRECI